MYSWIFIGVLQQKNIVSTVNQMDITMKWYAQGS